MSFFSDLLLSICLFYGLQNALNCQSVAARTLESYLIGFNVISYMV